MSEHHPIKARWAELDMEVVRDGVRRCGFGTEDALLVLNELEPGLETRPHSHDFAQIALVLEGRVRFTVAGEPVDVGPGEVLLIPAGAEHFGEPLDGRRALNLDVFAPARSDYLHLLDWMKDAR
jgi:quercetin dioxygenase-like cupin family protein